MADPLSLYQMYLQSFNRNQIPQRAAFVSGLNNPRVPEPAGAVELVEHVLAPRNDTAR